MIAVALDGEGLRLGQSRILQPFNLQITAGECVAIIGPSGAGKTSLLRLLGTELRGEVYLAGLFSQLDELLHENLGAILHRLPLSERIPQAAVQGEGPYAPSLQLAQALESEDGAHAIRALCEEHEISLEHVNRTLLRLVCEWPNQRPSW